MCSDHHKNHGCGQNALALLYLSPGQLSSAANSSNVPPEFTAGHNKDEVLEGKFRNLNFSPSTIKTTEYSFELFLSIIFIDFRYFFSS